MFNQTSFGSLINISFVIVIFLFITLFISCGSKAKQQFIENTINNGQTHTLGRYLLTVPNGSVVDAQFIHGGATVETLIEYTRQEYKQLINEKEQELKNTKHEKSGNMFVERYKISDNHIVLVSWTSNVANYIYAYTEYQYLPDNKTVYIYKSKGNADEKSKAIAIENQKDFSKQLRYRETFEIPSEDGFCINNGIVRTNDLSTEEVLAVIKLPNYPDINIAFESYVTGNTFDGFAKLPFSMGLLYSISVKTLRSGKYNIGPLKGQEKLLRYRGLNNKNRKYEFEWKTMGKEHNIKYPFMRLTLRLDNSKLEQPINIDEDKLIEIWDGILSSIRLRTGAVK